MTRVPFDGVTYRRLLRLAFADRPGRGRGLLLVAVAVLFPLWSAANQLFLLLDELLFPAWRRTPLREPVFVIGHARSGTTLMHTLLARDARFSFFRTWEMFLPSITQKKIVDGLVALDRRLGRPLARRVEAFEERAFAKGRQMHPMGLANPEEDEFLLLLAFATPVLAMIFPHQSELNRLFFFDRLPERQRRRVLDFYEDVVRRQLWLRGGTRHLSKNPVFVGKLRSLVERFPDARFVLMERHPYETIPSILKMMERNWKAVGGDRETIRRELRVLGELSFDYYTYALEVLDGLPPGRRAIVAYEDLVARPAKTIEQVYARLGLPLSPAFAERLAEEEKRSRAHRSEHVYSLEEYGIPRAEIRSRLAPLFERFGWEG
ncbi:MAG: sulfotransferase [Myxococcota bacterium]|nr:sulfotransferase [Myxococcota bacterium]